MDVSWEFLQHDKILRETSKDNLFARSTPRPSLECFFPVLGVAAHEFGSPEASKRDLLAFSNQRWHSFVWERTSLLSTPCPQQPQG